MKINKEKLDAALAYYNDAKKSQKHGHGQTIIEAAREYSRIKPSLDKMIEARKEATDGPWDTENDGAVYDENEELFVCDTRDNASFVVTCANEISKITEGGDAT